eukprot:7209069-Alexandrium_andersonii.AAC.1
MPSCKQPKRPRPSPVDSDSGGAEVAHVGWPPKLGAARLGFSHAFCERPKRPFSSRVHSDSAGAEVRPAPN